MNLKLKVLFDGKIYDLRLVVYAPKETADMILQMLYRILLQKGVIVND
jgi:hypothetical protein